MRLPGTFTYDFSLKVLNVYNGVSYSTTISGMSWSSGMAARVLS